MYLADTLSRAVTANSESEDQELESWQIYQVSYENKIFSQLENINSSEYLNVTSSILRQIKSHANNDEHFRSL